MWEIFVSYRREDGHATGRLADRLEKEFDIYIDRNMRPGDEFDLEIEEALDEARIVIGIVGKEWVAPANIKRLHDPQDWIHRELDQALNRTQALVIPVVVDEDINLPKPDELPEPLRRFFMRNAEFLRRQSWDQDLDVFVEWLHRQLGTRGIPRTRQRARIMPKDLPYLCNRTQQEQEFEELARRARDSRSLVCVLHGHKYEGHSGFVTRLRHRRTLEQSFRSSSDGVDLYLLDLHRGYAKDKKYTELLRYAIKRNAVNKVDPTDAELLEFLADADRPAVMMMQLAWKDIELYGRTLLDDLAVAWNGLIAQLERPPSHALLLWINLSYETADQELEAGQLPRLEKLGPVLEGDIQNWLELDEVRNVVEGNESKLLDIASDPQHYIQPGEVHMLRFVEAARKLMTAK